MNPTPRTIEELQAWYIAHDLPPEEITRFFIGRDVREPKAFGIYREGDQVVVYKNKADGSRAVRYHGPDEGYGVNELYLRLKQEIAAQKTNTASASDPKARRNMLVFVIAVILFVVAVTFVVFRFFPPKASGYYRYNDDWYYYSSDDWYYYEDGWTPYYPDQAFVSEADAYYVGKEYDDGYAVTDFTLTEYYSRTDSDSSWSDSDSWDFGSTDWGSDW